MLDIFQYDFMLRAFAAGVVTGVVAPTIGMFLVARRYSFMADTLAHASFAGVAAGALFGVDSTLAALVAAVLAALCVEELRSRRKVFGESALALFLSGGLALAAVMLSASRTSTNLSALLFGSIATVTSGDLVVIGLLGVAVLLTIVLLYPHLHAVCVDEELAAASGLKVGFLNRLLVVLAAVTVAMTQRSVGVLLVGALMVIPVTAAMQWGQGFLRTMLLSIGVSLASVVLRRSSAAPDRRERRPPTRRTLAGGGHPDEEWEAGVGAGG